jgi:WD40 repeat protein
MQNGAELMMLRKSSSCVSFSPDGNRILLGGGSEIRLLDADSGRVIGTIRMPREQLSVRRDTVRSRAKATAKICSVAFSPDGRRISSGSSDGSVKVWDIETGAEVTTLSGYRGSSSFAFSPDGKRIASSSDGDITIRDGATGEEVVTLRGHNNNVPSMAFSPDGKQIVSGDGYGVVKVWDVETGVEAMTLWESSSRVMFSPFVSYSSDGTRIISCGQHMSVRVWDAMTGAELMTLMGHQGYTSYVISTLNGKGIESGEGHISSVAFSPDGKRFITGSSDKTIKVWDFTVSPEVRALDVPHSRNWIRSVVYSRDGKRIAVCGNGVKVLDAYSGQELITIRIHAESKRDQSVAATAVKFSPDGKHIVSGHGDKTIRVWDVITGEELMTLGGHYDGISSVDYSPDGNKIVSGSRDTTVKVWDATTGEELMIFAGHKGMVKSVAFSADGKRIVSVASEIKLWDVATGKVLKTFPGEMCVSLSPDSNRIVSGDDHLIKVWDVETGIEVMTMRGHSGPVGTVYSVAFSPDGQRILSGSWKTVKIWDAVTGNELIILGEHEYGVRYVAFSPDGKRVISTGGKTIKLWDTASPEEMALDMQEPENSR